MPFLLVFAFAPAILMIGLAVALIGGCIWFMISRPYLKLENFCKSFASDVKKKQQEMKEEKEEVKIEEVKTVRTLDVIVLEKIGR